MPGLKIVNGQQVPDDSWYSSLIRSTSGEKAPKPILANAITVLSKHPEWEGVLAFNAFSKRISPVKPPPIHCGETWGDHEMLMACDWVQHAGILASPQTVCDAALAVAGLKSFHPVRQYLDSLEWDGVPRLNGWLETYLGVEVSDTNEALGNYISSAGRCWMISAIARIYQPGCQADHCLILEGNQGSGKSSALKILAGEWFTDHLAPLGTKDASQQLEGVWIVEMSELDSMRRTEISATKAFISCRNDRFRAPYARTVESHPRQMVFAGSTNDYSSLKDDTGNRRFWMVRCSAIDRESLARDRDQLWAEAVTLYRQGEPWWFTDPETIRAAEEQQALRVEEDSWEEIIFRWIDEPQQTAKDHNGRPIPLISTPDCVAIPDILMHALGVEAGRFARPAEMRVSAVLKKNGWCRKQQRVGDRRVWMYFRP